MLNERNAVLVSDDLDELKDRLAAERARLRREAGLAEPRHFQRPKERAFGAEERDNVTILFGDSLGNTRK